MSTVKHYIADKLSKLQDQPGQHILLTGATGSGKTTLLYHLVLHFAEDLGETIILRDTGKGNESLFLSNFKTLRYLVPENCNISLKDNAVDFEVCNFSSFNELFNQIAKDKFNIISVCRFLLDPAQWTMFWSDFFNELIRRGFAYQLPIPMCVVMDELSQITPSQFHRIDKRQAKLSAFVAKNVEQLRGVDIRLLGTSQGWTKLNKSVRISFPYYIFKRVAERVDIDIPVLKTTMNKIQSLTPAQFVLLIPEKFYSEPYSIPDLKIKGFCKDKRLIYEGTLDFEWQCTSELRPEKNVKNEVKELREKLKQLTKYIYENEILTQDEIAETIGMSQGRISQWINEEN